MADCFLYGQGSFDNSILTSLNKGDQGFGSSHSYNLDKVYKDCIVVVASCIGGGAGGIPSVTVTEGSVQKLYEQISKGAYDNYVTYRVYKGTNVGGTLKIPDCGYGVACSIISLEEKQG